MTDINAKVLLIYTGGTIGMVENPETGALEPFNFSHLGSNVPEIQRLNFSVDTYLFDPPIDSSDVSEMCRLGNLNGLGRPRQTAFASSSNSSWWRP